jgi:hypothetical protein
VVAVSLEDLPNTQPFCAEQVGPPL